MLGDLAVNHVIPMDIRHQSVLTDNAFKLKTRSPMKRVTNSHSSTSTLSSACRPTWQQSWRKPRRWSARKAANRIDNEREKAHSISRHGCTAWIPYATISVKLELMVDDEMWPLPKYRELVSIPNTNTDNKPSAIVPDKWHQVVVHGTHGIFNVFIRKLR